MIEPRELRRRVDDVLELHESGDVDLALQRCEELIDLTADPAAVDDPIVRESAFTARFERALLLTELGELDAAADAYADAAVTPTDEHDPDQRHEVAMALLNRGICLDAIGDHEQALGAYDELVVRYGDAEDPVTRDQVVRGRVNRAAALLMLDRPHEAATVAAALLTELSLTDALDAEQAVMALRLRAAAAEALEGPTAALAVLDDLDRIADDDPAVRVQLLTARLEQAEQLTVADAAQEAQRVLRDAVDRYDDDRDPSVAEAVAQVRARLA